MTYEDKALREALRRKYADLPQPTQQFKWEAPKRHRLLWKYIAAASVIGFIMIGAGLMWHGDERAISKVQKIVITQPEPAKEETADKFVKEKSSTAVLAKVNAEVIKKKKYRKQILNPKINLPEETSTKDVIAPSGIQTQQYDETNDCTPMIDGEQATQTLAMRPAADGTYKKYIININQDEGQ